MQTVYCAASIIRRRIAVECEERVQQSASAKQLEDHARDATLLQFLQQCGIALGRRNPYLGYSW
jgi:hypothetical protein